MAARESGGDSVAPQRSLANLTCDVCEKLAVESSAGLSPGLRSAHALVLSWSRQDDRRSARLRLSSSSSLSVAWGSRESREESAEPSIASVVSSTAHEAALLLLVEEEGPVEEVSADESSSEASQHDERDIWGGRGAQAGTRQADRHARDQEGDTLLLQARGSMAGYLRGGGVEQQQQGGGLVGQRRRAWVLTTTQRDRQTGRQAGTE